MSDCIFCKIINKEIPSSIVYEDEKVLAFNDINPQAPVHVLIMPKQHIANLNEVNEKNAEFLKYVHLAANKIAEKLGIAESGYRIINNCGFDAGQTVFHIHFHLVGGKPLGARIL